MTLYSISLYLENVQIALRSLLANKVRSVLTVLGTTIGVFAVIMIVALVTGLKDDIRSQIVSLGADILDILPADSEQFGSTLVAAFSKSEVEEFRKARHLYKDFTEIYSLGGQFTYRDHEKNGFLIGIQPEYFSMTNLDPASGSFFTRTDTKQRRAVASIGPNVADELYGSAARAVGRSIKINGKEFTVSGVVEAQNANFGGFNIDDAVYIPASTADAKFESARVQEMFMTVPDEDKLAETKRAVEKKLAEIREDEDFSVLAQEDLLEVVDRVTGLITAALAGIASISLLVGGIGIMNIMLVSVTERTREIGIRKAVGAEESHILIQFLIEAVVLSLLGGVIGLAMAFGVSKAVEQAFNVSSLITLSTVLGAISFSVIVGVIFGTAPAYKAAKKDPIEALRYNQ